MSNNRKTVGLIVKFLRMLFIILISVFFIVQLVGSIWVYINQDNLSFLMGMKSHIVDMVYFSITGIGIFVVLLFIDNSFHNFSMRTLENDKNELKAKLFDLQEENSKYKEPKTVALIETKVEPEQKKEEASSETEEKPE